MAVDVFHHHDGVVHQDADGEDQGKEGDPVQRVAIEVVDQERQGQRHGDGDGHHDGLPPSEGERDQDDHGDRGHQHVLQQLVGSSPWPCRRNSG